MILWLIGYCMVACLTMSAFEDHMVSTAYSSKQSLKERVKRYVKSLPESEQAKYDFVLDESLQLEAQDLREPQVDVSSNGFFRCLCRFLYSRSFRCCSKMCCSKDSRGEKLFDAGRSFYK